MRRTYTESQQKAIEAEGTDIVVSAGAGSGKTGVLVERFVQIVTSQDSRRCNIDKILVITFTEKATREMKSRITQALDALGEMEARRQIETAYISTIHAFCSRLLRENPFDAGVDPGYRVLEPQQTGRMLRTACENAVQAAQSLQDREILRFLNTMQASQAGRDPLPVLFNALIEVFNQVRGVGWRREDIESLATEEGTEATLRSYAPVQFVLKPAIDELAIIRKTFQEAKAQVSTSWATICDTIEAELAPLFDPNSDPRTRLQQIASLIERVKTIRFRAGGVSNAELGLITEIEHIKATCETVAPLIASSTTQEEASEEKIAPAFWKLLGSMWDFYVADKQQRGSLDNDDLQAEAVRLLERSSGVRRQYRTRFAHLMIDEFQDTNPLQMRLITLLHSRKYAEAGEKCLPNQLFIVGDVQQSIYAFRNADPTLFQNLERRFREGNGGLHVTLSDNFRSRPEILETVARIFGQLWRQTETQFTPFTAGADFAEKEKPSLEILATENLRRPDFKLIEPSALARRIHQMVQGQEIKITHKADSRCGKPVEYGDIAILFRALTDLSRYEEALQREDIPYYVVGGGRGYFARHEVRDLINVLTVIDTPTRDVAIAAALRSPFVGVSTDTLYRLSLYARELAKITKTPSSLFVALQDENFRAILPLAERESVETFLHTIEALQKQEDRAPVGHLLEKLITATHYDARLLCRPGGRRRLANVRKLLQIANSEKVMGVPGFIQRLKELTRISDREGDAPTEEEEANVVRIYTIHGAKGLEFPVVILPDLSRQGRPSGEDPFVCDPSAPALGNRLNGAPDLLYNAIQQKQTEQERQEMSRLLYVAMTRAREHLVLSGNLGMGRSHIQWMNDIAQTLGLIGLPQEPEERILLGGIRATVAPLTHYLPKTGKTVSDTDTREREELRAKRVFAEVFNSQI